MLSLGPKGEIKSVTGSDIQPNSNHAETTNSIEVAFFGAEGTTKTKYNTSKTATTATTSSSSHDKQQQYTMDDYMRDDDVVIMVNDGTNDDSNNSSNDYQGGPVDLDQLLNDYYEKKKQNGQPIVFDEEDAELFQQAQVNTMNTRYKHNNQNQNNGVSKKNQNNDAIYEYDDDDDEYDDEYSHMNESVLMERLIQSGRSKYFFNPNKRLLDTDASLIPGSPFSKPKNRVVNRPFEPLIHAKYTSSLALLLSFVIVIFLFFRAIYYTNNSNNNNNNSNMVGLIILEIILSVLTFFGIFWNIYYMISNIMKCCIPSYAYITNTKFCSILPEMKNISDDWYDVTIQIPVYKESLQHCIIPTIKSCIVARDYYRKYTNQTASCNIVICDDGMMSLLHNNFPAAAMLWETINLTNGTVYKLGYLLKNNVPRASRMHLKGLRSKNVYEVFYRMLFYYHYNIGFVARSTVDQYQSTASSSLYKNKIFQKKTSNLNSHLRLALGAQQQMVQHQQQNGGSNNTNSILHTNSNNSTKTEQQQNKPKKSSLHRTARSFNGNISNNNSFDNNTDDGGFFSSATSTRQHVPFTYEDALMRESHNDDGSRYIMYGGNIKVGDLICVNDANTRMSESVIFKTVPEFLNDKSLGYTQHMTKSMMEQKRNNGSYYINMMSVYTDFLYQGYYLLSSILGCHPPLLGHGIFVRTEAIKQCGRIRTLRKAQQWLYSIGLQFLPVDQVGFANLQAENRTEYWSEHHACDDFELMIHLYSLGFNGRYIAYPDCEFQMNVARYFDEDACRYRELAFGAHELIFNPFQDMLGKGVFTPIFRIFMRCDIASYYKIYLAAYLCSFTSGGVYIIIFIASALTRILNDRQQQQRDEFNIIGELSPANIIILTFVLYYLVGFLTFMISLSRMSYYNNKLLFAEYRKKWCNGLYLLFVNLRYNFLFQLLFYNVTTFTFNFLGSMDHMLARPNVIINVPTYNNCNNIDNRGRLRALYETINFNYGSWLIATIIAILAYLTILHDENWDYTSIPKDKMLIIRHAIFTGPVFVIAIMSFIVPIILNPWILGWPFLRQRRQQQQQSKMNLNSSMNAAAKNQQTSGRNGTANKSNARTTATKATTGNDNDSLNGTTTVDLTTLLKMNMANHLTSELSRAQKERDVEIGSIDIRTIGQSVTTPPPRISGNNNMILPTRTINTSAIAKNAGSAGIKRIDPNKPTAVDSLQPDIEEMDRNRSWDESFLTTRISNLFMSKPTSKNNNTKILDQAKPVDVGGSNNTMPHDRISPQAMKRSSSQSKLSGGPIFVSANAFSPPPIIKPRSFHDQNYNHDIGNNLDLSPTPFERRLSRQRDRSGGSGTATPNTIASSTPSPPDGKKVAKNGGETYPLPHDKWGFPAEVKDADLQSI